jgi:diketogulonate reductase-like aldo/keto reductase
MKNQEYYTTLENIKMPKLIYGTAWKKESTKDLVVKAIKLGFRGIDTACQAKHYNEPLVGEALKVLEKDGITRDSIFLQTKFTPVRGQDPNNIPYDKNAPLETQVAQSFKVSQKNLNTNYVDSLVLHSPMDSHNSNMIVWNALEKIHQSGGTKQIGISNCYDLKVLKAIYDNAKVKPSVIQNRFYKDSGYDKELRKWCSNNGIIYQSFWTLTANPDILASKEIKDLSKKFNKTTAQILFRYLTQNNVAPLTGTCSDEHMKEDLNIFDFELSNQEIEVINKLFN